MAQNLANKAMATPAYIELHTRSAFSFLRGASLPEQLAEPPPNSNCQ